MKIVMMYAGEKQEESGFRPLIFTHISNKKEMMIKVLRKKWKYLGDCKEYGERVIYRWKQITGYKEE